MTAPDTGTDAGTDTGTVPVDAPVAVVWGLAIAGASTVRALRRHGYDVTVADDTVDDDKRSLAATLGVTLLDGADVDAHDLLQGCTLLAPAPGVPETHRIIEAAGDVGVEVVSELELAYRWEQQRPGGPRPMLAVTGTDGKTSTTRLAVEMLRAAGHRALDVGNTDTPLVDALEMDVDVFVVECSSFRLTGTPTFRAEAAAWLNLQPDHLNWHRSMESYEAAKAQIYANQRADDVAIGTRSDHTVQRHLAAAPGRRVTVALDDVAADYHCVDGELVSPRGVIAATADLARALPHDITNALTAAALVLESGLAEPAQVADALASFRPPPHRIELLRTIDGVEWYNDSKATTPHAAAAAIRSFPDIVLIAGGADKGVDLAPMTGDVERVVGLVGIGTTGADVAAAFVAAAERADHHIAHVDVVDTLEHAVPLAQRWSSAAHTVLLSPGCASLDQFGGFEERGDRFRELVDGLMPTGTDAAIKGKEDST